jgi:hypothetical protein
VVVAGWVAYIHSLVVGGHNLLVALVAEDRRKPAGRERHGFVLHGGRVRLLYLGQGLHILFHGQSAEVLGN